MKQITFKELALQFGSLEFTQEVLYRLDELGFTCESLASELALHKSDCDGNPSIYCGTYGKYNNGSIQGLWLDLTTFNDYDDFVNLCMALHADEDDPELMFQDFEGFPRKWYDECLDEDNFNNIMEYCELIKKHDVDAVDAFIDWDCEELEHFEDCYMGEFDSEVDYAEYFIQECYDLDTKMGGLASYFDYEAFARDLFMCDYYFDNGHVFRHY